MQALLSSIKDRDTLRKTLSTALFVGIMTILIVLNVDKSNNYFILYVGDFLGSSGNKLFLIGSNLLIIGWAWRKSLHKVIKLTLGLELMVLILVQGLKLLDLGSWSIRPHGGNDGFPSGHATHAFAIAFVLTLLFPRFRWLWYMCAASISWSRIETSSHNGFQITAGIILGTGIAWIFVSRWLKHFNTISVTSHRVGKSSSTAYAGKSIKYGL